MYQEIHGCEDYSGVYYMKILRKTSKIKQSFHLQFIIVEELSTFSLEKHSS